MLAFEPHAHYSELDVHCIYVKMYIVMSYVVLYAFCYASANFSYDKQV